MKKKDLIPTELTVVINGKTHRLVESKLHGKRCCDQCSLKSTCDEMATLLYLPGVCSSATRKNGDFRFEQMD